MLKAFQSAANFQLLAPLARNIHAFARESRFVQRASKFFCPEQFLIALLKASSDGKASLQQIATQLSLQSSAVAISAQAIHERLHRTFIGAECFLVKSLSFLTQQKFQTDNKPSPFKRILVQDSTQLALHVHNSSDFPGHGNHLGSTAGCKIDICFDLLTGQTISHGLFAATTQDKTIGYELLEMIQKDDLVLRDMGYFVIEYFAMIETANAYWLSRLPQGVKAYTPAGETLETILVSTTCDTLDIAIKIGEKSRHAARLIAVRCGPEESKERRRSRRKSLKIQGKTASKAQLARCDWHIMLTNIEPTKQNSAELYKLYRQRWQIELCFRGWKKSHNLKHLHKHRTSPTHLKVLILAAMILLTLTLRLARLVQEHMKEKNQAYFSVEKMVEWVSLSLKKINTLQEIVKTQPDERHLCSQKRTRKSLIYQQHSFLA